MRVELDDDVKKVSITGKDSDGKVVMRQEPNEEDLNQATGGGATSRGTAKMDTGGLYRCNSISFAESIKISHGATKDEIMF